MDILVTGGAGFIGSHLIEKLAKLNPNNRIMSIDNYSTGIKENEFPELATYLCGHTSRINSCIYNNSYFADFVPEIVYHLGEYSRIVPSFEDIQTCFHSNIEGTFSVLEYCCKHNAKLVYAASSSKFGNNCEDQHLSPYAWMKAKNVELINNYKEWFGLKSAICYFYNVYGGRQISRGKYATLVGIFQEQYLSGEPLTVVEPGTQRRDFTHVDDIVDGLILAGGRGDGDNYLLGTGKNYSIVEVTGMFDHPYVLVPARTGERFTSMAYESRAQSELGWSAKISLPDYINEWKKSIS